VIEKVESFRPEVYTLCLGKMSQLDRERFGQRKVEVRDSGLTDNVAPGITECSRGVKSEGRGIEPLLQLCALRPVTRQTRVPDQIGAVNAVAAVRVIQAGQHRERHSSAQGQDTAGLPSTDHITPQKAE
jgi:hypothetical protein